MVGPSCLKELSPAATGSNETQAIPKQDTPVCIAHFSYLSSDGIRLTKKCVDPGAVDHFFGQLLDGRRETTILEFRLEFVLP